MAYARIVLAQGLIDGVNTVFTTSEPYVAGSTAYIYNGRIHSSTLARGPDNAFGYIELDPDAGSIQVDIPPEEGDVVQIFYWSRRVLPAPIVERLAGTVIVTTRVQGIVRTPMSLRLTGSIRTDGMKGAIRDLSSDHLAGVVKTDQIIGVLKETC